MSCCEYTQWDGFHNTSYSSYLTNGSNMLVFHYSSVEMLVRDKQSSFLDPFISYAKKLNAKKTHPGTVFTTL